MMPWEIFAQLLILIVIGAVIFTLLLKYLDGQFDPWVREYKKQELERLKKAGKI